MKRWRVIRALAGAVEQPDVERIINILVDNMVEQTIEIPEIVIIPTGDISFGFNDFDLTSLGSINYQPMSDEIQIAELERNTRHFCQRQWELHVRKGWTTTSFAI